MGPDGFITEFHQLSKNHNQYILNYFKNIETDVALLNSFYESSFALTPKPSKGETSKGMEGQYPS
jgi:hypothetical protein